MSYLEIKLQFIFSQRWVVFTLTLSSCVYSVCFLFSVSHHLFIFPLLPHLSLGVPRRWFFHSVFQIKLSVCLSFSLYTVFDAFLRLCCSQTDIQTDIRTVAGLGSYVCPGRQTVRILTDPQPPPLMQQHDPRLPHCFSCPAKYHTNDLLHVESMCADGAKISDHVAGVQKLHCAVFE